MLGEVVRLARTLPLLIAVSLALCGCTSNSTHREASPGVKNASAVEPSNPTALRRYLRAWQATWERRVRDQDPGPNASEEEENAPVYNPTPDASWDVMQRLYEKAALAYLRSDRRLGALAPPSAMRPAHDAYHAAVQRQETRMKDVADAFAGTDPYSLERALEELGRSNTQFDSDGAHWETAVIAACKASGVAVPKIVRREYISNGSRTRSLR
jgi:hypothetical protein